MNRYRFHYPVLFNLSVILTLLLVPLTGVVQAAPVLPSTPLTEADRVPLPMETPQPPPLSSNSVPPAENPSTPNCALLDDPAKRGLLSGALETALLYACGRHKELPQVAAPRPLAPTVLGDDVLVNDPTGEMTSTTQSGVVVAYNDDTGILCAAYNDSYHGVVQGTGYTGFSSSSDGGATWTDRGSLNDANSYGYPALVWRRADGHFFLSTLYTNGLGLWDLGAGCNAATWVGMIHSGSSDDKEMLAADNNPASPYYGRLYATWTDFTDGHIYAARSGDGGQIWSAPVDVSGHDLVNGAWPAVDPVTGDVYIAWTHWDVYPDGPIDIEMAHSTDGGAIWTPLTNPMSDQVNPRDATATTNCSRPALNGDIRYYPYPQIAVDHNSNLHVVYSYDPDGYNTGDVINIYHRRSTDQGTSWGTEIQVNDDWTGRDQFFPTLAVGETGVIGVFWYDRRLDSANMMYDRYMALSRDGGLTFEANQRISDESSPVVLDPLLATCYHGDYDSAAAGGGSFYTVWGDDRRGDADVWSDTEPYFWDRLFGTVYDAGTMHGLADARTETVHPPTGTRFSAESDEIGYYEMHVPGAEAYAVTAQAYGYVSNTVTTTVDAGGGQADIPLTSAAFWDVQGQVTDANTGYPVYAHLTVTGDPFVPPAPYNEAWSDGLTGDYALPNMAESVRYTLTVEAEGYISQTYSLGYLTAHLFGVNFALQPDLVACTAPGYEMVPPCQVATGAVMQPALLEAEGCPCADQTHTLFFANHTGADEEVLLSYATSPGAGVMGIPTTLGVIPNNAVQPFDVQVRIDWGVSLNAAVYVTVTASLASNPTISDTMVIEKRATLLAAPWEWEEDAPVAAFYRGAGATLDDYAYVIGGQNGLGAHGDTARYRPDVGWETLDDKPTPAANIDTAELNSKIYVAGGYDAGYLSVFEVLDPAQPDGLQWTTLAASLPISTSGGAMAAACDKVYFMGGNPGVGVPTSTVYMYDPVNPGPGWQTVTPMSQTQRFASAVTARGLIFAVGDWDTGTLVQVYDCATDTWLPGYPQLTVGREAPGTTVIGNRYVVAYGGGSTGSFTGQPDVEYLDLDNLVSGWQAGPPMNQGRTGPGGGIAGGRLIAIGGYSESNESTNTAESIALCPDCGCGVDVDKDASADWVHPGEVVTYTVVITTPDWLTGTVELADALPTGAAFTGYVAATYGTAWYSPTANTIYWTRPPGTYSAGGAGSEMEVFTNTWADTTAGLVYNPETDFARYVHEGSGPQYTHDVAYPVPHPVLHSFNLSDVNPGWSNRRTGVAYDYATGHYFLADYFGGGGYSDNIVEIDPAGHAINAWETDGASNDSYDGSVMSYITDITVVPGAPTRYFATALFDGGAVYELDLIKAGQFVTDTWGKVMTCTVPGITDTAGIDYDAQNGVLYHSDWDSENVVVTDLHCNVLETFNCNNGGGGDNLGITFIEGQWPPEVWVTDYYSDRTTRCEAVGREPQPEVVTVTYAVEAVAPVSSTLVNTAILACDAPGCADPSALSVLLLRTIDLGGSVQRALDELGYSYDTVYAFSDWTGIDFAPYDVVVIGMDGGTLGITSTQKIRTDAIDQGKRVVFLGGSAWADFVNGVDQYLVSNDTATYNWAQTASPHFSLVDPAHPLAQGLPMSRDFVNSDARWYQLRVTDPDIEAVAQNGDGYTSYLYKTYPGGGDLVWFIQSPQSSYWSDPADFSVLKRIVSNALARPREYVAEAAFHIAPRPAITWTKEIYINGNYLGRYDEGPFSAAPGDDVQIVDRLDYIGAEPLFVQLLSDWSGYPVTLTEEYHSRGVVVEPSGDWFVTLLPNTNVRLVKTLRITDTVPVVITEQLYPDGMPMEERTVAFEPPTFAKDGPAVAYHGQIITYTITLDTLDPLFGSLRLTDTLPAGVEYAGNLNSSYGSASYSGSDHAVYWTNTPAFELTYLAADAPVEAPTDGATARIAPTGGPLSLQTSPPLPLAPAPPLSLSPSATWFSAAPMPQGTVRYARAQCPGEPNRFYIISGVTSGGSLTDKVWRYDADVDTWTELAAFPSQVEGPSAVCYQGRIYVAGGGTNQFYIYDIARDAWSEGPALPRSAWGAAMGAWDGRLFLAGGDNNFFFGGQSDEVDSYDIAAGTWVTDGATMPTATAAPGWTQVGQYLYVVGGWGDSTTQNITTTQRYNMVWDYWQTGPTFTSGRGDLVLAATEQYLYAIGGDADGGGVWDAVTLTERLDYTNWYGDVWTDITDPLPTALTGYSGGFCTTARSGGEVWSVGGLIPSPSTFADFNQYRPSEPCVAIPPTVTLTFNVRVTAGPSERVTNDAVLNFRGYMFTATTAFDVPLPEWEKQANGHPWAPGLVVSVQPSDTVTVTDVISTASAFTLREEWDTTKLTLLGYQVAPPVGTVVPYPWVEAPDAPFAYTRFDAEYSYATGHVYMLGGRLASGNTSGQIWEFDPATGVYTDTGVDMPVPVSNYNIARLTDSSDDEVLVTFGGRLSTGVVTDAVQGFYPTSGATVVFDADPYPVATSPGGVAVTDNIAYVFGGFDASVMISATYIFDINAPAGARWTAGPNLNQARSYIGAAVVDGVIYALGGDDYVAPNLIPLTITEKLDTASPVAWDDVGVADLPITCGEMQTFGFDAASPYRLAGSIVVAGCGQWPYEIAESLRYDVVSDTWDMTFPDLNEARRNHAGALIPAGEGIGRPGLWVWGGRQSADSNVLNTPEYYDLDAGVLLWDTPAGLTQPVTLTKFFYVEPYTWTTTLLQEQLGIGAWSEMRDTIISQEPVAYGIYLPLVLRNSN